MPAGPALAAPLLQQSRPHQGAHASARPVASSRPNGTEQQKPRLWIIPVPEAWRKHLYKIALYGAAILPLVPSIILICFLKIHGPFGGKFALAVIHARPTVTVVQSILVAILVYLNVFVISNLLGAIGIVLAQNPVFIWLLNNVGLDRGEQPDSDDADSGKDDSSDRYDATPDDDADDRKTLQQNLKEASADIKELDKDVKKIKRITKGWTWRMIWVGVVCFLLLAIPHIVWTGALSQEGVPTSLSPDSIANAPVYNDASASNWSNSSTSDPSLCPYLAPDVDSSYTSCPAISLSNGLFGTISLASSYMNARRAPHLKNDLTGFSYLGRSYGVGSAAGLFFPKGRANRTMDVLPDDLIGMTYIEPGFNTQVRCVRNTTSDFRLSTLQTATTRNGFALPPIFGAQGRLPNSDWTRPAQHEYTLVGRNLSQIVAWSAESADNQHVLAIAAGANYTSLDRVQCSIDFQPTAFSVAVNYTTQTINVFPLNETTTPKLSEQTALVNDFVGATHGPNGGLTMTVLNQLNIISVLQSSTLTSDLGEALTQNVAVRSLYYRTTAPDENGLAAIADSIAAVADDVLTFVAGSQYFVKPQGAAQFLDPRSLDAVPVYLRVQIGDDAYVWTALILTLLLFVLTCVKEAVVMIWGADKLPNAKPQTISQAKRVRRVMPPPSSARTRGVPVQTNVASIAAI